MREALPGASLEQWISHYLTEKASATNAPGTVRGKSSDLAGFLAWYVAENSTYRIRTWRSYDTRRFVDHLLEKRYKPTSINRKLSTLKDFSKFIMEKEPSLLSESPLRGIKNLGLEISRPDGLSNVQCHRFLKATQDWSLMRSVPWLGARDQAIVSVLYMTGLRVGEILSIKIDDYNGRWFGQVRTKGTYFRRVFVPSQSRTDIDLYLTLRRKEIVDLEDVKDDFTKDSPWLFVNRYFRRMSRQSVYNLVAGIARLVKAQYGQILHVHPHTLRHTFALEKIKKTKDPALVAQLLGHRTMNYVSRYTQRSEAEIEHIMEE